MVVVVYLVFSVVVRERHGNRIYKRLKYRLGAARHTLLIEILSDLAELYENLHSKILAVVNDVKVIGHGAAAIR